MARWGIEAAALPATADGAHMGRGTLNLRSQVWGVDDAGRIGPDSVPADVSICAANPHGDGRYSSLPM
jgi:hypothetical protein